MEILEEASQRLTQTLGQELMFLKALTSESLGAETLDVYPLLIHAIQDLLGLRFRDKPIQVEINGEPLEDCRGSLVFPFEPYTMEVILQIEWLGASANQGQRPRPGGGQAQR